MDLEEIQAATRSEFCYTYRELPCHITIDKLNQYCESNRRSLRQCSSDFTVLDNSRWVLRNYLAIKFVTASALLLGSAKYAYSNNLFLGLPYFNYYAVLNACRAFLLTSPKIAWNEGKSVRMSHQSIINRTVDLMRNFDHQGSLKDQLNKLRDYRELFSYRFPLSGPELVGRESLSPQNVIHLARLIAEVASLNSECLQGFLRFSASPDLAVSPPDDDMLVSGYLIAGVRAEDYEDRYRFSKFVSGWHTVSTLELMASDGLMEELYGSWTDPNREDGCSKFNPDDYDKLVLWL